MKKSTKNRRPVPKNNPMPQNVSSVPAVKAEPTEDMVLQFGGKEIEFTAISEKVRKSCEEHEDVKEIRQIKIYVKPEDNRAYYVINGEIDGSVELV